MSGPGELERARRLLDIGRSLTSELRLEVVLHRVLQTARELTDARYAALGVLASSRRELSRFLTDGAPEGTAERIGHPPRGGGVLGVLIEDPRPLRLDRVADHPRSAGFPSGHPPMTSFLGVPVLVRGSAWGNLYLTDKLGAEAFSADDEEALVTLAAWAGIAVANARTVEDERLRAAIDAAEAERRRWARELHDETLQGLGALRLALTSALRAGAGEATPVLEGAVEQVKADVAALRAIIADLRPAALDELGLVAALRSLAERVAARGGFAVELQLAVDHGHRSADAVETLVFRIAQEALTNAARHARAGRVLVGLARAQDELVLDVVDDGIGLDPTGSAGGGLGLAGMRERAALAGARLEIGAAPGGGTRIRLRVRDDPAAGSPQAEA